MEKIKAFITGHPYKSAAIASAVVVLFLLLRGGGSKQTNDASGSQTNYAMIQQQQNAALAQVSAQLQAVQSHDAAQLQAAKLQADYATAAMTQSLEAKVTLAGLQKDMTTSLASIQAELQKAALANQATIAAGNNATALSIAQLQADVSKNATNQAANTETLLLNSLKPKRDYVADYTNFLVGHGLNGQYVAQSVSIFGPELSSEENGANALKFAEAAVLHDLPQLGPWMR